MQDPEGGEVAARHWLDVPFSQKDEAKAAGARWDPEARRWYAPKAKRQELGRWAGSDLGQHLPGEDRTFGSGLFVDLVPSSCWFTNVRSAVNEIDWERIRRMVLRRAGNQCEACGRGPDRDRQIWMEAHERWHYDESRRVQSLRRLILLCTVCHRATHSGLAQLQGHGDEARDQLMTVNGWSAPIADDHIAQAFAIWQGRCRHDWSLDLSMLTGVGIAVQQPGLATDRRRIAAEELDRQRSASSVAGLPTPSPPAGWYEDPLGRYRYRWWQGERWSEGVSDGSVAEDDPEWGPGSRDR